MSGAKIAAGLITIAFVYVISPLLFPIAMGGIFAVLFFPWMERLERRKIPAALGSGFLTLGITAVVIVPMSLLIFSAARAGFDQLQQWKAQPSVSSSIEGGSALTPGGAGFTGFNGSHGFQGVMDSMIQIPHVHRAMEWITDRVPVEMVELSETIQDLGRAVGFRSAEWLGEALGHLPRVMISLGLVVLSVFFFLIEGKRLVVFFRKYSVFTPHQTDQLMKTTAEMCRSVVLASVISGGSQALVVSLTCLFTGTPHIALIGFAIFIGSFIPLVGSFPIAILVGMNQWIEGHNHAAIILFGMAFVVAGIDNAIRPLFLKGSANLHPFLAFIAAFGGLQTLGFLGVFLGPIVAALFVVILQILLESKTNNPVDRWF